MNSPKGRRLLGSISITNNWAAVKELNFKYDIVNNRGFSTWYSNFSLFLNSSSDNGYSILSKIMSLSGHDDPHQTTVDVMPPIASRPRGFRTPSAFSRRLEKTTGKKVP